MELTNREIAAVAWLIAFGGWLLARGGIARSVWQVLVAAAHPRLAIPFVAYLGYLLAVIVLAEAVGIWNPALLKDSVIWIVVGGIPLFAMFTRVGQPRVIRGILRQTIAVPEVIAFVFGLVSFSILIELALLPSLTIVGVLAAFAATRSEYAKFGSVMNGALQVGGLVLLTITVVQLVGSWRQLEWNDIVLRFYLPIWLAAAAIPFVTLLGGYSRWEQDRIRSGWLNRNGGNGAEAPN
ncbi:MAG: hypothetical protein WD846_04490 [Patescibacteria group bacterium]